MSYLDYPRKPRPQFATSAMFLSAYLRKRQKDLEDSRSFHEENFQENNDINKGKHYLISETMEFIKQLEVLLSSIRASTPCVKIKGSRWQSMSVGGLIRNTTRWSSISNGESLNVS